MLLFCVLFTSLHISSSAALPTTQSHLALQPTPTPTTSYSPSNGSSSFEPYLLFANPNSINQVRLTGRNLKLVTSGLGNADALDFDIRRGSMCWSDLSRRAIACAKLDGSEQFDVLSTASQSIGGIAVDWITQKLYWTDADAKEILLLDLATRLGKVLANTGDQTLPRSLAVDPTRRWLYWTDCGTAPKIEKISMDGASREVLHSRGLGTPNALTVDHGAQTLYWTDSMTTVIESSSTDGSGRRIVTSAVFWPYSITVFGTSLYWTDWQYDAIFHATTSGRNVSFLISGLISRPKGIQLISYERQPRAYNPCEVDNGGCSHLCLLSSAVSSNYTCACPQGYLPANANQSRCLAPSTLSGSCVDAGYLTCCSSGLCLGYLGNCSCSIACYGLGTCCADINVTCYTGQSPFVVFSNEESIYHMDLNGSNPHVVLTGLSSAAAVDYDYRQGYMYWTELSPPAIWKAAMNGSSKELLVNTNLTTPAGLAVDWVTSKLYWTDEDQSMIGVFDPTRNKRSTLISTGPSTLPRAIVLDPITRWLYWTDWGSYPVIGRASMDGMNRTILQDYNLGYPNALALDHAAQRLYWGDAGLNQVETCLVDGSRRQVVYQDNNLYPYSMVLFAKQLFITNWIGMNVVAVATVGAEDMDVIYSDRGYYPKGVRVVYWNIQKQGLDPCATNNGGCTHLCLLSSVRAAGYSCTCPDGTALNNTQGTCDAVPPSPPPTPVLQGSCRLAGYTACCPTSNCVGSPQEADCYCDHMCYKFHDCCPDIMDTCPMFPPSIVPTPSLASSAAFANTTTATPTSSPLPTTDHYTSTTNITSTTTSSQPSEVLSGIAVGLLAAVITTAAIIFLLLVIMFTVCIALVMRGHKVSQSYSVEVTCNHLADAQQLS